MTAGWLSHYWDGAALVLVDGRVTEGVDDATADAHTEHTGFDARTEPGDYGRDELADQLREAAEVAPETSGRPEGLRSAMNAFGITLVFKPGPTGRRLRISGRAVLSPSSRPQDVPSKLTFLVSTVPAVRPGAV
ncbi:MAG: hypothetical protein M3R37_09395 [Actinomycetota bacterium]|nr:hypothetical protein [Actinomycetota bacterium]